MTSDRIREIQKETAYPESRSVCQALLKVWNECAQGLTKNEAAGIQQGTAKNSIIRIGDVCVMNGKELWVNTESDEIVKFFVEDHDLRWKYYCGKVRITIELLEEE